MCACVMFKECANDTRDIIFKTNVGCFIFLIGIDNDIYVCTAQTFVTLQFLAFIIISNLYVLNIFFLCAGFFFTFCLVTWVWTPSYRADKVMNKSTSQKQYCVFMTVFGFEIYCITQYVYIIHCTFNSIFHNLL